MLYRLHRGLRARVGRCVVPAFVACLSLSSIASAQTSTLSGVVSGGGSPINGATVEALTNGTTTVAGTSTTNGSGQYSIALPPAVYDLRVTPPAGSAFNAETLQDVDLSAGNQQVDVILITSGGGGDPTRHEVSGTVRGRDGAPLAGVSVSVYGGGSASAITDANGHYSVMTTATGLYLEMYSNRPNPAAPDFWYLWKEGLVVGSGLVYDVNLSVPIVNGVVTDVAGNAVGNGQVNASFSVDIGSGAISGSSSAISNASGAYSMRVLSGLVSFRATAPAGTASGVGQVSAQVNGDTTQNITLPASTSVTGVLRGYNGQPVANASVTAYTSVGPIGTRTAADGTYALNVTPGSVTLYVSGNGPIGVAPTYWEWYGRGTQVTTATTINIDLPVVAVSGSVTTTANLPVMNGSLNGNSYNESDPQVSYWSSGGSTLTTAGGTYSLLLFRGAGGLSVTPPAGMAAAGVSTGLNLTADTVKDLVLPDVVLVSGIVRGIGGQPIAGARVRTSSAGGSTFTTTDASGNYSTPVGPGNLSIEFGSQSSSNTAPTYWLAYRSAVVGTTPLTIDLNLDVVRLSGRAQDSNGTSIPGVQVSTYSYNYSGGDYRESSGNAMTDATGNYSVLLLAGEGSGSIQPPSNSGFSGVGFNRTLTGNLSQRIVLQRPDTTAPVIVSGPVVLHLSATSVSVGWTTNEPSTSVVDFGIGGLDRQTSSTALVTQHTVTLLGLTANEIYSFRVSSRDRNNNGPAQSSTGFFTMLSPPGDVTPPSILAGPSAVFLGDSAAIIQWLTNEPASELVRYGTTREFGSQVASAPGEFVGLHAVVLPGLSPDSDYFAQVESADPDGHAVVSSTFTFRTAHAPDIQPPVITTPPFVASWTHNAATIRWTTDEAASSGVSYNDGSVFNVTNSDSLTTMHEVILAGLSPARSYNFTVASKDAAGNGPTLSGPLTFTTLGAPDVTPPIISAVSVTPGKNSAAIAWTTSEPSTSAVRYGEASGVLNGVESELSTRTSHLVSLTGLHPGTTYYYTVGSSDPSGNPATSVEAAFLTLPEDVNVPPTPPSPVTASPNPGNTGSFTITWGASSDDGPGGVKEYVILRDGTAVDTLPPTATSYPVSGVPQGSYTYQVRASDFSDATSLSDALTVVVDLTAPSLDVPASITTPATTNTDAIVTYTVTAADNRDSSPVVSCAPASGSAFAIATTTVACTARDAAGNVGSGSFTVTVTDPFAPILSVPASISRQAENQNGAVVLFRVTATDNHDPAPVVSCSPSSGSLFPVGTTVVNCTATDASGNTATRSFNVAIGAPPKVASSIAVSPSSTTPTFGQPIVFTASVDGTGGSTPTGTVSFLDGTTVVGQAALAPPAGGTGSPVATLTIATLPAGTRSVTAQYAGDLGHEPSTSAAVALEVGKAGPAISVTGGTFVYDAAPHMAAGSVTGVDGTPIGALSFTYNGSAAAPVTAGAYAVIGTFAGNGNYLPGSANGTLTINPGGTSTMVQPGPSVVFGQTATIGAVVSSPTGQIPQGTIQFFDGVTLLGSVALNAAGSAQTSLSTLAAGGHTLRAVYSGGGNFAGSSSAPAAFAVDRALTATSVTVAPNPAGYLAAFKVTATVAVTPPGAGTPGGVVEFFTGSTSLGSASLALVNGVQTAVLPLNGFPSGSYPITARYTGTASFAPSISAPVDQVVRSIESSTWTTLAVSPTPSSRVNTNATLRAVVVPLAGTVLPAGLVQFYAWGSPIGTPVALVNVSGSMTATLVTAALPSGLLQLRAQYLGGTGFAPSLSTPVSHTVYASTVPFATTTTMTATPGLTPLGQPVTVTARVASGTRATPGYFLLFVDGVATQVAPVVSGEATTFTVPSPPLGLHAITVQFVPGTTTLAGSLSQTFVFVQ